MSAVFNGGNGGAICDGCRTMVMYGSRPRRGHRFLKTGSGSHLHYCNWMCIERHIVEEKGMHRGRALQLTREAERLKILETAAEAMGKDHAVASAFIAFVERKLVTKSVPG